MNWVKSATYLAVIVAAVGLPSCVNAQEPKVQPSPSPTVAPLEKPEPSPAETLPHVDAKPPAGQQSKPAPQKPVVVSPSKTPVTATKKAPQRVQQDNPGSDKQTGAPPSGDGHNSSSEPAPQKTQLTVAFEPPVPSVIVVPEKKQNGIEEWIRAILIPVILWLMSMLALYNVRRHRLIETLKVDMVNQLRSQFEWLGQIEKWLENHDTLDRLPIYSNVSDAVFKESLGDIKRYLWDQELDRVYMFYDCIGDVQKTLDAGLSFHNKMKNSKEPSAVSLVDFESELKLRSSEDLWGKICEAYSASLLILLRLAAPIVGEARPKLIRQISPKPSGPQFNLLVDSFFVKEWVWRLFYLWIPLFSLVLVVYVTYLQFSALTLLSVAGLGLFVAGVAYMLDRVVRNIWPEYKITMQEKPSDKEGS